MDKQKHKEEKEEELVWDEGNTKAQNEEEDTKEEEADSEKHKEDEVEEKEEEDTKEESEEKAEEEESDDDDDDDDEEEEEEDSEDREESEEKESAHEEIRKSEILRHDLNKFVRDNQPNYNLTPQSKRPSGKLITLILLILAILVIGGGIYFIAGIGSPKKQDQNLTPTPTVTPTPTPVTLNRSEWSFEVLNGSGITGEAKKVADGLKELGYQVTKVGNADKDNYETNQFFVSEALADQVDFVVLDIKDIIKIASVSGKLEDSTPSARIIIGKE